MTGIGSNGTTYLYRNPLISKGEAITREPWYQVPCCPSNISRIFAELSGKLVTSDENTIYLNQFIGSSVETSLGKLTINSSLPWSGTVEITIDSTSQFDLKIRIPSWVTEPVVKVNGKEVKNPERLILENETASGFSPKSSYYMSIENSWATGDAVNIHFPLTIKILRYHKKMRKYKQRGTLTRGPLVYCLESIDNPDLDIFNCTIDQKQTFETIKGLRSNQEIVCITGYTIKGEKFTAIPYYFWGNRGKSKMNAVLKFK